jgi:hypothetical protein
MPEIGKLLGELVMMATPRILFKLYKCVLYVQQTHIEGLQPITKRFGEIVEEVRRKPYDVLDATKNIFDRDFLEFNVHIHDLEFAVQARHLYEYPIPQQVDSFFCQLACH